MDSDSNDDNGNNKKAEGDTASEGDEAEGGATDDGTGTEPDAVDDESYEEECVICLDALSGQEWGRCTPCNHAFHKKCWWEWENAHNERVSERRAQGGGNGPQDGGPKCCLCNTVNKQFVDGAGKPAHNPSPYVASEADAGGSRFARFVREATEEASGFMEFLQSELRESGLPFQRGGGARNASGRTGGGGSPGRGGGGFPPFFGPRNAAGGGGAAEPGRMPFGVPPLARGRSSPRGPQARQCPYATNNPFNLIGPGTQIITQHLVSSPQLNGRQGAVLRYQPESGRYLVRLEANIVGFIAGENAAPVVAMKPENLLQTVKVRARGLRSQPGLNGKEGTVIAYSRERARYVVRVGGGLLSPPREVSLRPENVGIPVGTCVRLEGLRRAPHWNGKYGTIVGWAEDDGPGDGREDSLPRYEVQLSRQYAVRVKMENVRL